MRSAGCVVNDLWDRDIDRMVARTAGRPLASGTLRPRQALVFLAVLLLVGLAILLQLNRAGPGTGRGVVAAGGAVSAGQAGDLVAAAHDGLHLRLRRAAGLRRRRRADGCGLGGAVRRGDPVGPGLRHDLRAPGPRGRCAGRGEIDRAAVRRADRAVPCGLLWRNGRCCWRWPAGWPGSAAGSIRRCCCPALLLARQVVVLDIHDPALCLRLFRANREVGLAVAAAVLVGRLAWQVGTTYAERELRHDAGFVRDQTRLGYAPLVPEISSAPRQRDHADLAGDRGLAG